MALLDFLKNKKEKDKARESSAAKALADKKKPIKKDQPVLVEKKPETIIRKPTGGKKEGKFSYTVIKEPHISEKANDLSQQHKYTFKVYDHSNKLEIKKSVEGIYGVNVLDVNMIKIPHKKRRLGKTQGFKKAFTKAVVTIKEGQKIDLF